MGWKQRVTDMLARVEAGSYSERSWVFCGPLRAYVRVTRHGTPKGVVPTLDVASIEVDEAHRGHGRFTRWIAKVEAMADQHNRTVFVESVLNPRLIPFLERRGYHADHVPCCYYREPK